MIMTANHCFSFLLLHTLPSAPNLLLSTFKVHSKSSALICFHSSYGPPRRPSGSSERLQVGGGGPGAQSVRPNHLPINVPEGELRREAGESLPVLEGKGAKPAARGGGPASLPWL